MIHECSWPSHFKRLIKINTHGISIGATMDDVFLKTILRPLIMDHYLEKDWSDWNVLDPAFGWLTRVSAFCPHPFLWFKKSLRVRVYVRNPIHDFKIFHVHWILEVEGEVFEVQVLFRHYLCPFLIPMVTNDKINSLFYLVTHHSWNWFL